MLNGQHRITTERRSHESTARRRYSVRLFSIWI